MTKTMTNSEFTKIRTDHCLNRAKFSELLGVSVKTIEACDFDYMPVSKRMVALVGDLLPESDTPGMKFKLPFPDRGETQVLFNGSAVGMLIPKYGCWFFSPAGMAAKYGKKLEGTFHKIDDFMEWWAE